MRKPKPAPVEPVESPFEQIARFAAVQVATVPTADEHMEALAWCVSEIDTLRATKVLEFANVIGDVWKLVAKPARANVVEIERLRVEVDRLRTALAAIEAEEDRFDRETADVDLPALRRFVKMRIGKTGRPEKLEALGYARALLARIEGGR